MRLFCSEEPFVWEDMENEALGICESEGNILAFALAVIGEYLSGADTEAEQMYNGGLSVAAGLAQLNTQHKAACSESWLLAHF